MAYGFGKGRLVILIKNPSLMKITNLLLLLFFPILSFSQVTDHEGKTYKTVKIGNQTWMAENLSIATFKNGEEIYLTEDEEEWFVSGLDELAALAEFEQETSEGRKYIRFYNYFVLTDPRGIVPDGWRIPTDEDWRILAQTLGGEAAATPKLKSTAGWWTEEENGTNESGFNALPLGMVTDEGEFLSWNEGAYFWSIDLDGDFAINRSLTENRFAFEKASSFKSNGLAIRLIKN